VKVAVVLLAAFVPLWLNVTGAGPVTVQVYVKPDVPVGSLAREASETVVDVWAVTWAGVVIVGPRLVTTVTAAVPVIVPVVARTVVLPVPLAGALYRPPVLIVPTPPLAMVQVKAGCAARALPNWSLALAANCWEPLRATVVLVGDTLTEVTTGLTV
jgi:hypothetical protein